ncbi:hypothetical protein DIPPA_13444 [Diplonema papillatum]|nr:hypothetical protein DIPPA_13444 [Diplonema papillatum]
MLALFRQRDARRAERMAAVEDQETTRVVERALEAEAMEQIRAAELARQEEMAAFEATRREEEYHRASERVREAAMDAARAAEAAEIASRADRAAAVQKDLELRAKKMQLAEEDLELQTTALNRERQLMSREREQGARERQWVKQKDEEYDKERRRYEAAAEGLKKRLAAAEEQGRAWQAERDHALAQLDDAVRSRKALALELDAVHGRSPSETDADWQSRRTERAKYLSLARKGEFADGPLRLKIKSAAPEQVAYFTIGSTLPVPLTCETSVTFGSAPAGGGAVGRLESGAALKQAQLIVDVEHGFIEGDTLIFANTRLTEGGRLTTLSGEVLGEYVPSLSRRASGRPSLFAGSEHDPAFDGKPKDAAPARRRSRSSSRATRKSRSASVLSAVFPGNFFSTSAALAVHSQALGAPPAQQQASAPADQDPAEPADEISTARVAVTPGGATVAEVCRSAERLLALLCFKAAGGPAPAKPAAHAPWDDASPRAAKASAGQKTAGHAQQPARQSDGLLHVGVRRVSITLSVNDARVEGWRLVEVLPAVAVVPETCRLSTYVEGKGPIRLYGSVAFSGITEMAGRARDMVRTCALCGLCLDEDGHARCGGEERKPAVPQPDEDSDVFKPIPSYAVTAAGGYLSLRAVKGWSDDDVLLLTEGCSFEVRSERSKARSVVHTLWYATQYETYDAGVDGISIERAGDGPQFKLIGCFRTGLIAHADHTAGGGDRLDAESAPTGSGGGDTGGGGTTTSTVPRAAAVKLGFLHGSIPSVDGSACSVGVQFNQEATWGMVEEFVRSVCFRNDSINPTRPRRLIELVFTCGRPKGDPPPEAKTLSLGSTRRAPDAWWDALPPAAVQFSFVSEINVVNVDEPTEIHVLSEDLRYSLPSQFLSDDLRTAISVPSRLPFCKGARVVDEDTDVFCEGVLKVYLDALSDTERVVFDPSASDNVSVGPHKHVKQAVYHRKKPVAALLETPDQVTVDFSGFTSSISAVEDILRGFCFYCDHYADPDESCVVGQRVIVVELTVGQSDTLYKRFTIDVTPPHLLLIPSMQRREFKEGSPPVALSVFQTPSDFATFPVAMIRVRVLDNEEGDEIGLKPVKSVGEKSKYELKQPSVQVLAVVVPDHVIDLVESVGLEGHPAFTHDVTFYEEPFPSVHVMRCESPSEMFICVSKPVPSDDVKTILKRLTFCHVTRNPLILQKTVSVTVADLTHPEIPAHSGTAVVVTIIPTDDATEFRNMSGFDVLLGSCGDVYGTPLFPHAIVSDPDTDDYCQGYIAVEFEPCTAVIGFASVAKQHEFFVKTRHGAEYTDTNPADALPAGEAPVAPQKRLPCVVELGGGAAVLVFDDYAAHEADRDAGVPIARIGGELPGKKLKEGGCFIIHFTTGARVKRETLQHVVRCLTLTSLTPSKHTIIIRCNAGNVPVANEAFASFTVNCIPAIASPAGLVTHDYKSPDKATAKIYQPLISNFTLLNGTTGGKEGIGSSSSKAADKEKDKDVVCSNGENGVYTLSVKEMLKKGGAIVVEAFGDIEGGRLGIGDLGLCGSGMFTLGDAKERVGKDDDDLSELVLSGKFVIGTVHKTYDGAAKKLVLTIKFDPTASRMDQRHLQNLIRSLGYQAPACKAHSPPKTVGLVHVTIHKDPVLPSTLTPCFVVAAARCAAASPLAFKSANVECVPNSLGCQPFAGLSFSSLPSPLHDAMFEVACLPSVSGLHADVFPSDQCFQCGTIFQKSGAFTFQCTVDDSSEADILSALKGSRFSSTSPGKHVVTISLKHAALPDGSARAIWTTVLPPILDLTRSPGRLHPSNHARVVKPLEICPSALVELPAKKKSFRGGLIVVEIAALDDAPALQRCIRVKGCSAEGTRGKPPPGDNLQLGRVVQVSKSDEISVNGIVVGKVTARTACKLHVTLEPRKEVATAQHVQMLFRSLQYVAASPSSEAAIRVSLQDGKDGAIAGGVLVVCPKPVALHPLPLPLLPMA